MFQSQIVFPLNTTLVGDLGDDNFTLWVAPQACEIVNWTATPGATITAGAGTGLALELMNGGTSGTATTALGTVGSGTADTGWVADVPRNGSLVSNPALAAGEALRVKYDETGTVNTAWLNISIGIRYGSV